MDTRRLILLFVCIYLSAFPLCAQVSILVSGGAGSPSVGSLGSSYQFQCAGFYRVMDRLDLGISIAYQTVSGVPAGYAFQLVPLSAEGRFHFAKGGLDPYFLAGIGIAHLEYNYDEVYRVPIDFWKYQTSSVKQFYHDNHLIYALGCGMIVPLAGGVSVDVGFRLNVVESHLAMERVFDPADPVGSSTSSSWLLSQWSAGFRWDL